MSKEIIKANTTDMSIYKASKEEMENTTNGIPVKIPYYKVMKEIQGIKKPSEEIVKSIKVIMLPNQEISRTMFNPTEGAEPAWVCKNSILGITSQRFHPNLSEADKEKLSECTKICPPPLAFQNKIKDKQKYCKYAFFNNVNGVNKTECREDYNRVFIDIETNSPFIMQFHKSATPGLFKFINDNFIATGNKVNSKHLILTTEQKIKNNYKWYIPKLELTDEYVEPNLMFQTDEIAKMMIENSKERASQYEEEE